MLAYKDLRGATLQAGLLSLSENGNDKPVVTLHTDEPNFFPGLIIFRNRTGTKI